MASSAWVNELVDLWGRLDIPEWSEYSQSFQQCSNDLIQSGQSTWKFIYLTFRPIVQLIFIVLQGLWAFLLKQGWISVQKGASQARTAIIWFYLFQRNLTKKEILGEFLLVGLCFAIYYFRKWLKKQTYWSRATLWASEKKKKLQKVRNCCCKREIFFIFRKKKPVLVSQLS